MKNPKSENRSPKLKALWIGIGVLIILVPLGLIVPELFRSGGAWGEWGTDELKRIVGYIPEGMKDLSHVWKAPVSDYGFAGWDHGIKGYIAYMVSALAGAAAVVGLTYLFVRILKRPRK